MTSHARNFGVQSYCFRSEKDNAKVARMVQEIGLDKIEVCAVHADLNDPEAAAAVAKIYQDAGVSVISIGVETFSGDPAEEAKFKAAQAMGAGHISAHFKVDSFARAVPMVKSWSQQYGIKVGIHTHGGYMFGGQPDVSRHLVDLGAPEVGLCIDTAWVLQIGPGHGNPVQWARDFAGQIHGVHYKDFTFGPNGQWEDVVVGTGNLDLPAFVQALEDGGFDGMAVIEYEGDVENPVPALKTCVEKMRSLAG